MRSIAFGIWLFMLSLSASAYADVPLRDPFDFPPPSSQPYQSSQPSDTLEQEAVKRSLRRIENQLRRQNGEVYFNEKLGRYCRDRGALGFYLIFCD